MDQFVNRMQTVRPMLWKQAAMRIWQRTLSYDAPLRFTKFLSNGDSKAYSAVPESKVYDALNIEKEDCTNHVAKKTWHRTTEAPCATTTRVENERAGHPEAPNISDCHNKQEGECTGHIYCNVGIIL